MPQTSNARTRTVFLIIFVAIVLLGVGYLVWSQMDNRSGVYDNTYENGSGNDVVVCTLDAKLCPDGSYVGRTGPRCEFAACPGENSTGAGSSTNSQNPMPILQTYSDLNSGITFQYPAALSTQYIHTVDWPPKASLMNGPFSCLNAGSESASGGLTQEKIVGGRSYCVTTESEGAAGSIYTNYAYSFSKGAQVVILTFGLRSVQCANYDDPQKAQCENERRTFNIDPIIDRIAQSVEVK